MRGKLESSELIQVERTGADIGGNDPDENKRTAEEGVKGQLHCAVLLVSRSPDRDQEVLGHNDQFVKDKEQEQVGAQKNAEGATYDEQEPEKELVRSFIHIPGKKDGADCCYRCNQDERQTDSVHREVVIHAQGRYPGRANNGGEMREIVTEERCQTNREGRASC